MTKPIEGVSERILVCAREEFLEKGYSEASLRTIAAKADTTTGSIYSRFGDKEGLFCAIVEPAAEGLTQIFLKTQEAFHAREAEEQPKVMEDYVVGGMDEMLDYVYDRFDDFRLLLDASSVPSIRISWNIWWTLRRSTPISIWRRRNSCRMVVRSRRSSSILQREPCSTACLKLSVTAWTEKPPENISICWNNITMVAGEPS